MTLPNQLLTVFVDMTAPRRGIFRGPEKGVIRRRTIVHAAGRTYQQKLLKKNGRRGKSEDGSVRVG
jgi:hypothetical protein